LWLSSDSVYFLKDMGEKFKEVNPILAVKIWEKMVWLNVEGQYVNRTNYEYIVKLLKKIVKVGFADKAKEILDELRIKQKKKFTLMELLKTFESSFL